MQTIELSRLLNGVAGPDGEVTLLDVGCGEGRHSHAAALSDRMGEVVGVDVDIDRLRATKEGFADVAEDGDDDCLAVARGDALELPFPDRTFDAIVCSEVLEHTDDYEGAIDELARVLTPGGRLGVSVPRYGPEAVCWRLSDEYHQVDGGHVRIFSRAELLEALERRGLQTVHRHFAHALHSPLWWLKCLWWDRADEDPPMPLAVYERFLERQIVDEFAPITHLEAALNPVFGKSVVLYLDKEQ
jgi:SAM-dependent methyltransferase